MAASGFALAWAVGGMFTASAMAPWVMGLAYNVPPVRLKGWPYLDVLSESINNPIRLALGWLAYYFKMGLQPGSAAQRPEALHRERGFMVCLVVCLVGFVVLTFTSIPVLCE